jgi:hypothetical protein
MTTCGGGEPGVGLEAELGPIGTRPLQVIAENLVELDEILRFLLEPRRKADVQLGAGALWERVERQRRGSPDDESESRRRPRATDDRV